MSDDVDVASMQEEAYLAAALNRRHASLPAIGQCYSCGESVSGRLRFCDTDCRDDWEKDEAARRIGGRPE